ncbi:MAG: tyrosine-type recombinase/integrase [Acidiphilium sp.]|nr:tyrosine-type recombinase/integrase [Acidiphilium sp.]
MNLTTKTIQAIKTNGRYSDGNGLYFVKRGNSTAWCFRWMKNRKAHETTLGHFPAISLAAARDLAANAKFRIQRGISQSRPEAEHTFASTAAAYFDAHAPAWRSDKHATQWMTTLETYAFPHIGNHSINDITTDHILAIISGIWIAKPETASRVRGRIESVIDYATSRGWRTDENPARWKGHLSNLLPSRAKLARVTHHEAANWRAMPDILANAPETTTGRCLRLLALTATRSAEARGATWSEIDTEARTWIIPGTRTKNGNTHIIPLSDAAMAVLADQPRLSTFIFPGRFNTPMSDITLASTLTDGTVHGLRSTFRTWVQESTNFPRELAEAALAHTNPNKVEAAYARSTTIERRRELMQAWGRFCTQSETAKILAFG